MNKLKFHLFATVILVAYLNAGEFVNCKGVGAILCHCSYLIEDFLRT